jgi:sulfite exporter TauE/SafE
LYAFSFGAGTMVSPLFLLAVFSGFIPSIAKEKQEVFSRIFALLGGLIIVVLGLRMLFRSFYGGV